MVSSRVFCCAALALLLAMLIPAAPWCVQRIFWYLQRPRATQALYKAKYPPDIGLNLVRGLPSTSMVTDERMDLLERSFTHRHGDTWVVTYQKVGTTWAQYIVSMILGKRYPLDDFLEIFDLCPWPELGFGFVATPFEKIQQSAAVPDMRCFKSHWPRKDFFANLPNSSKVIYVMRDIESVAVSYWHHMDNLFGVYWVGKGGNSMTWDMYFEKFCQGDVENGDYMEHVASWWKHRNDPNFLLLRYEDLKADTRGQIRRIADFMEVPITDTHLDKTLEVTSLREMKKLQGGGMSMFFKKMGVIRGEFVRKGGDGAPEQLMTEKQRVRLKEKYERVLKPLDVPYEYMFST